MKKLFSHSYHLFFSLHCSVAGIILYNREHQYREGYARSLEREGVEWDDDNVEHMWEQVKRPWFKVPEKCVAQ